MKRHLMLTLLTILAATFYSMNSAACSAHAADSPMLLNAEVSASVLHTRLDSGL